MTFPSPSLVELLKTKLNAINADCEQNARAEIDNFYAEAKFDGTHFRVPSFRSVIAVWLRLIATKESEFLAEIARVLKLTQERLSEEDISQLKKVIEEYFTESRYADRMNRFIESIKRKYARYGLAFDPQAYRADIYLSEFQVGILNSIRRARANLLAELYLYKGRSSDSTIWNAGVDGLLQTFQYSGVKQYFVGSVIKMAGDQYVIGQAGAVGPNSTAENITFQQVLNQNAKDLDFSLLADELSALRAALRKEASEPAHDKTLGNIAAAEEAARRQDGPATFQHLKSVGKWGLDFATKVGTTVAAKAIEQAIGI
jgi:hypothetical protein